MISFEPSIVVIDDKKEEIQGVIDYFINQGHGCKYFNADLVDGDLRPDISYTNVNLVFLDLIYSQQTFDAELCANWIQAILPEKSFYILIIWSKDPVKAEEVKEWLKRLKRLPFICLVKNKSDFVVNSAALYNFEALFAEINLELGNTPALAEIGVWKKSITGATNKVIGGLTKESKPEEVTNKLKKVIIAHGGTSIKTAVDFNRKRSVLFDALDNVLISNTKQSISTDLISQINKDSLYNLETDLSGSVDRELNSWFHFRLDNNLPETLVIPGLISENNHRFFQKYYSIQDDEKVKACLQNQVGGETALIDIVLVITRPCDIAQGKFGKNIKLLSGVLIKNCVRKPNNLKLNIGTVPDSIKYYEHLYISEEVTDGVLLFDFRYVFSVPEQVFIKNFKNLKIFNKELLSEMQVEYSSYSSRLGITKVI